MPFSLVPRSPRSVDSDSHPQDKSASNRQIDPNLTRFEAVLSQLRQQIVAAGQETQWLVDPMVITAQRVTCASGAALGMKRDGAVRCVGRSGEAAPELGICVNAESGISGECLRTGRALRCDDTGTDSRVDAEVCAALGIHSIAAVPVSSSGSIVGVLEVFSTSVRAFTDEHIAFLSSIAGLLESTLSSEPEAGVFLRTPLAPDLSWAVELLRANVSEAHAGWWRTPKWRYGSIAGAVVLIGLLSALSWRFWHPSFHDTVAGSLNYKAEPKANFEIPREVLNPSQRSDPDRFVGTRDKTGLHKLPLAQASQKELDDEPIVRRFGTTAVELISGPSNGLKPSASETLTEPPQIPVSSAHSEALVGVIASAAPMPSLDLPVSQGVRPLFLERRVMPRYPAQALALKLEGTVIVEAWVNELGRVDQVSLVSGNPQLGQAAIEAVRDWRYRPALLNGKPVRTETQIKITFQASTTR